MSERRRVQQFPESNEEIQGGDAARGDPGGAILLMDPQPITPAQEVVTLAVHHLAA